MPTSCVLILRLALQVEFNVTQAVCEVIRGIRKAGPLGGEFETARYHTQLTLEVRAQSSPIHKQDSGNVDSQFVNTDSSWLYLTSTATKPTASAPTDVALPLLTVDGMASYFLTATEMFIGLELICSGFTGSARAVASLTGVVSVQI